MMRDQLKRDLEKAQQGLLRNKKLINDSTIRMLDFDRQIESIRLRLLNEFEYPTKRDLPFGGIEFVNETVDMLSSKYIPGGEL